MIRSMMSLVLVLGVSSFAVANDKAYFQIKKVSVSEVTDLYSGQDSAHAMAGQAVLDDECNTPALPMLISRTGDSQVKGLNPLDELQVWVDQIINLGKKIWTIVEAGKPVYSTKMDAASALPRGVRCWTDMAGWSAPQSKIYRIRYENTYGADVVDFTYRVMFTANGNIDGVGKYIMNATFVPANIRVGWGFKFDANAQVAAVFNQGTKQDPVAGIQMNLQWRVDSPVTHEESTDSFFMTGDNKLVKMK